MNFFNLFIFLVLIHSLPVAAYAQSFYSDEGYVEFSSSVPLHSFKGVSNNLVGKIDFDKNTVDFFVDLATLDTGNEKRDKDMRETLEVSEHPFAEFFGRLTSDFNTKSTEPQKVTAKGEFKVHGVPKTVEVTGTLRNTADGLKLTASWTVLLSEHDIEPPGILFYKVNDEQEVSIEILLTPEN